MRQTSSPRRFEIAYTSGGGSTRGPRRRRVDEPAAVLEAALEEVQRRAGVLAHGPRRVGGCALVGFGHAREMEDAAAAREQRARLGVAGVHAKELRLVRGGARAPVGPCQPDDLVAALLEEVRGA